MKHLLGKIISLFRVFNHIIWHVTLRSSKNQLLLFIPCVGRISIVRFRIIRGRVDAHIVSNMKKSTGFISNTYDLLGVITLLLLVHRLLRLNHCFATMMLGNLLLDFLNDKLGLLLMIIPIDFEEHLNGGVLECLHSNFILNFGTTLVSTLIEPFELGFVLVLLKATLLGLSRKTSPRNIIISYNLELGVQGTIFLAQERTLKFMQGNSHCLVLLDI